ncbi:MAG: hypothetical protein IJG84_15540 [Kiritimatiellae bacterium]|nr:hypothetical protein [Kiritimatiellia bacterium]
MRYPLSIREEELKNKVSADWFKDFDTTQIVGNVDFCVAVPATQMKLLEAESVLWAEAKKGNKADIRESFIQLILTIGKEKTFDKYLPPKFLGAFDAEKIAFIPYHEVMDIFEKNDFNWNVTPSDHDTKEFKELDALIGEKLSGCATQFNWLTDEDELRKFIKANFKIGEDGIRRLQITKNNFTHIYSKWREAVMPTIEIPDWDVAKKNGIIDADFFLADILSQGNIGLSRKLNILLKLDHYKQELGVSRIGLPLFQDIRFKDGQKAHRQFWNRYKRPPREEYREYIVNRRDLLVPQDVRERKGSFFTPKKWVELSQHYLELELGENWQDEYYVWDCCAGTGNLLAGLTNKHRVWASTLDMQDVAVMKQRIANGANLLDAHVFQFDFLNDPLDSEKIPEDLRDVLDDVEKRKRLVIYINPPYAEAGTVKAKTGTGTNKTGVAVGHAISHKYKSRIGAAANEIFALFLMRINDEIPGCVIGQFSKLKHLQSPNFAIFRGSFRGLLVRCFIVPADTFDNVKGKFPIGFFLWRQGNGRFSFVVADVYNRKGEYCGGHTLDCPAKGGLWMDWLKTMHDKRGALLGHLRTTCSDFQNQGGTFIASKPSANDILQRRTHEITVNNFFDIATAFAVRISVESTWLNDRDQFLYPNNEWKAGEGFQADCLVYTLFHSQNRVKSADGINHWIQFTEKEVNAQGLFKSHFMSDFLAGKGDDKKRVRQGELFVGATVAERKPIVFSDEAKGVMDAGRELWRYYHAQPNANPNASFYDIRLHFQGSTRDAKGKERMNNESSDARYTELLASLRAAMKQLARRIEPKLYEYGFLKR